MNTFIKTAALGLLLFGFGATVQAQQRGQMNRPNRPGNCMQQGTQWQANGMQRGPMAVLNIPGLTDEQKEQIRTLHLSNQAMTLPLRNKIREKEAEIRTLSTSGDYDEDTASALVDEITSLKAQIQKNRLRTHQQVRELLKDEQQLILDNMYSRRGFRAAGKNMTGPRGGRNW